MPVFVRSYIMSYLYHLKPVYFTTSYPIIPLRHDAVRNTSARDHDANHNKLKLLYDTIITFIVNGLHFYLSISCKNSNSVIIIGQPFYTDKIFLHIMIYCTP